VNMEHERDEEIRSNVRETLLSVTLSQKITYRPITRNFALNSLYSFGMHPTSVKFVYLYTNYILLLHLINIQYS
jgi:hypothetical protein